MDELEKQLQKMLAEAQDRYEQWGTNINHKFWWYTGYSEAVFHIRRWIEQQEEIIRDEATEG